MYAENRANLNTSSDARNVEVVASQWPMNKQAVTPSQRRERT